MNRPILYTYLACLLEVLLIHKTLLDDCFTVTHYNADNSILLVDLFIPPTVSSSLLTSGSPGNTASNNHNFCAHCHQQILAGFDR